MSQIEFITIVQKMLMLVLELVAPVLLVSVIVGLAISIFQSVTQIQESTLTFVPKIFAALLTLMLMMPWMLEIYITSVQDLFSQLSSVI